MDRCTIKPYKHNSLKRKSLYKSGIIDRTMEKFWGNFVCEIKVNNPLTDKIPFLPDQNINSNLGREGTMGSLLH